MSTLAIMVVLGTVVFGDRYDHASRNYLCPDRWILVSLLMLRRSRSRLRRKGVWSCLPWCGGRRGGWRRHRISFWIRWSGARVKRCVRFQCHRRSLSYGYRAGVRRVPRAGRGAVRRDRQERPPSGPKKVDEKARSQGHGRFLARLTSGSPKSLMALSLDRPPMKSPCDGAEVSRPATMRPTSPSNTTWPCSRQTQKGWRNGAGVLPGCHGRCAPYPTEGRILHN